MSVDDKLHVLHIASGDLWAGAEVQLATLAGAQSADTQCHVSVILLNAGRLQQELIALGIEVIVLDESRTGAFSLLRMMMTEIRRLRPDIVHTHRLKENVLGSIAARVCGDIPSLRTAHGASEHAPAWYKPKSLLFLLDRLCGRHLQKAVIAVTDELAGKLESVYRRECISVIENGIDTRLADTARRAFDSNNIHIGIIGRLVPVKRVDLFLQMAAILTAQSSHPYKFHVYGDGPLSEALLAQRNTLGLDAAIQFHGHSDDIHNAIHDLDLLMITSDHEGLPMTLLECMLLETSVAAHAVGGIPVVLDQGRCGVLIEAHDAQAYADAVEVVFENEDARTERTRRAKQRVLERYSAQANANACIALYQTIRL